MGNSSIRKGAKEISQVDEFKEAIESEASSFGIELSGEVVTRLARYYKILHKWNPRLHLVAPCSPDEFARERILSHSFCFPTCRRLRESREHGSGAGLPIIPCLIARPDISAMLIESSTKKAIFLREALNLTETAEHKNNRRPFRELFRDPPSIS